MQVKDIHKGQVVAVPEPGKWGISSKDVAAGNDARPGLVLGVGKYRSSYVPCGVVWVDSEDPQTAVSALVMYPKNYQVAPDRSHDQSWYWTWESVLGPGNSPLLDPRDWQWEVYAFQPRMVFSFIEWAAKHAEKQMLRQERDMLKARMSVLRNEVVDLIIGDNNLLTLISEAKIVPTDISWSWDGHAEGVTMIMGMQNKFPPEIQIRIDEMRTLKDRIDRCLR